jgi:hypothetical protein
VLQSEGTTGVFTRLVLYQPRMLWSRKDKITIINETSEIIQVLIAPDPNQVILMERGAGVSAGLDGVGVYGHIARRFVPKDGKTTKKLMPPNTVEVLRLNSPKVYVTVLSDDSMKEWDKDIVMHKSDKLQIYNIQKI